MEMHFSFAWVGVLSSALSSNPWAKNVPPAHFLNALFESADSPKINLYSKKRHCLSNVFTAVMNYSDAAYAKSEINSSVFLSYNFPSLE